MPMMIKKADGFKVIIDGWAIPITDKEYAVLHNIVKRNTEALKSKTERIVGSVQSDCQTRVGCLGCPYKRMCDQVDWSFFEQYQEKEHQDFYNQKSIADTFGIEFDKRIFWSNTMEELLHYAEGEI